MKQTLEERKDEADKTWVEVIRAWVEADEARDEEYKTWREAAEAYVEAVRARDEAREAYRAICKAEIAEGNASHQKNIVIGYENIEKNGLFEWDRTDINTKQLLENMKKKTC